jgi:glutamate-1-semialdehyde aminotransferase
VQQTIDSSGLPWNVTQLGCRAEYQFLPEPARNGTAAHASHDTELESFLHLHALNRGVMITPFHNMALIAPQTTAADVDRHTELFSEAVSELVA